MRMRLYAVSMLALLVAACAGLAPAPKAFSAGYQSIRMTDANQRPIALDLWFPTEGVAEAEHNYGISKGSVATGASIAGDHLPIVLLSHGAMGAAVNYSWIAEALARRGYVVLGVSHFGESPAFGPSTINPINVSHFGDRTRDFKAGLAYLLSQPGYASHLDADRLGLLGHSSGGTTVMMLAGGKFLPADIAAYCRTEAARGDKSCAYPTAGAMDPKQAPETLDLHVSAVVALDPALGMGFNKDSLASVTAPVLVIGSEQNDFLHFDTHAGRLMGLLPSAERVTLQGGEGHFVYVDVCDAPIQALGVPLCKDREGVDRANVHERLSATIAAFFDKTLRTKK
jgi:predicted dienelactone hydrolase